MHVFCRVRPDALFAHPFRLLNPRDRLTVMFGVSNSTCLSARMCDAGRWSSERMRRPSPSRCDNLRRVRDTFIAYLVCCPSECEQQSGRGQSRSRHCPPSARGDTQNKALERHWRHRGSTQTTISVSQQSCGVGPRSYTLPQQYVVCMRVMSYLYDGSALNFPLRAFVCLLLNCSHDRPSCASRSLSPKCACRPRCLRKTYRRPSASSRFPPWPPHRRALPRETWDPFGQRLSRRSAGRKTSSRGVSRCAAPSTAKRCARQASTRVLLRTSVVRVVVVRARFGLRKRHRG